jgi:hypothetical protein
LSKALSEIIIWLNLKNDSCEYSFAAIYVKRDCRGDESPKYPERVVVAAMANGLAIGIVLILSPVIF